MDIERINTIWPEITALEISTEHGTAIKLTGKGAKVVANHLARENYLNGFTDTLWRDVRHGIGYLVPLYSNPLNNIL